MSINEFKKLLLKIVISASLLVFIFANLDTESFVLNFSKLDLRFVPLILLFLILNYVVSAFRWKALLIHGTSKHVSVKYLIYLYFTGAFFNNFMPTSIGGDVYKVFKLGKKIHSSVDAFSATFMERFTGVIALVLISLISLVKLLGLLGALLIVGFIVGIVVGYFTLSFLSSKSEKLKKIYDSLNAYRGQYRVLFWAFLTSFIVQLLAIFTQYFIFSALGVQIDLAFALAVFPVITLAGFFIPSLNGVGVQDALYMRMFATVGVAEPLSLSASVIYHLFRLGVSLIGGVFYALGKDD